MATPPNVFQRLHKWASRQEENYCTEALSVLFEVLLVRDPVVGVRLVAKFTNDRIVLDPAQADAVTFVTQPQHQEGRPDLEIRTAEVLVLIEVKVEEDVRAGQLAGYRRLLDRKKTASRTLGILTRYPVTYHSPGDDADFEHRWHTVAVWLEKERARDEFSDPIARFLCEEFHSFLRAKGMALSQIDWQFAGGVRAMQHMIDMMLEAARSCRVEASPRAWIDCMGIALHKGRCWIGFYYSEPERLYFECYSGFDPGAAQEVGYEVEPSRYSKEVDGVKCVKKIDLSDESIYFFSRSKVGQLEYLIGLFRSFLEDVQRFSMHMPQSDCPTPQGQ
jgi:hypothetical protein